VLTFLTTKPAGISESWTTIWIGPQSISKRSWAFKVSSELGTLDRKGSLDTYQPELTDDGKTPLQKQWLKPFLENSCAVTNTLFTAFVGTTGYLSEAKKIGVSFAF
jgi:hypothetical protein